MAKLFKGYPSISHEYVSIEGGKQVVKTVELKDVNIKFDIPSEFKNGGNDGNRESTYRFLTKDNVRPEVLSNDYYEDPYLFWLLLKANDVFDHYSEFALPVNILDEFIFEKYKEEAAAELNKSVDSITIDEVIAYTKDTTAQFINPDGFIIDQFQFIQVGGTKVSLYQLEVNLNEEKRNISIVSSELVPAIEKELSDKLKEI